MNARMAKAMLKGKLAKAKKYAEGKAKVELKKLKAKFVATEKKIIAHVKKNPDKAVKIAAAVGAAIGAGIVAGIRAAKRKK
jgi:ElaB/YqjD/DUF883 family membrane-anchored ribosome-binding protein